MAVVSDISSIRKQFPALTAKHQGKPIVYLDNGATSHKPQSVIDSEMAFYQQYNSNIHRGVHYLSQLATEAYEQSRALVQTYINAAHNEEIIITSGTTASINLVAHSFGKAHVSTGDEVIISAIEHHSNIVPWQMMCEERGAHLKVIPMLPSGELDMEAFKQHLNSKTKLVAVNHISNSLGTINPVKEIIAYAHQHDAAVLIDGAQAMPHQRVDVQDIDADFYCFSGHKMFGPTGIGVLYGKKRWLNSMPPYQGGGEMIESVSFEQTTYNQLPHKFEAGTPNIAGGIGLGAAIKFLNSLDFTAVARHEQGLLQYATTQLSKIEGLTIYGNAPHKASVISFGINHIHPYDIGTLLDKMGIAVRTGHHCTQPIMDAFNIPGTVRASFALYNNYEDVDLFISSLHRAINMLQ